MLPYPKKVEIHKFEKEGKKFLLDVHRSISMEISDIWNEILDLVDGRSSEAILEQLSGKYPKDLLIEAIEQLEKDGLLVPEEGLPVPKEVKIPEEPKIPINAMDFNVSHNEVQVLLRRRRDVQRSQTAYEQGCCEEGRGLFRRTLREIQGMRDNILRGRAIDEHAGDKVRSRLRKEEVL